MQFKTIVLFTVLCTMQGISSKPMGGFWGGNPFLANNPFFMPPAPLMDPTLRPIISEIQMRLAQAQALSKAMIGMNVGLASKNIGMTTSQAKTAIKNMVESVKNNPSNAKECLSLQKPILDQLNTQSKAQITFCSKSSQISLKSMNQVQKDYSYQIVMLNQELNMAVSQCQLENPLPADAANVTECVTGKAEEVKEKVAALENDITEAVQAVDTNINQIVGDAKTCTQNAVDLMQGQAGTVVEQLNQCNALAAAGSML